MLGRKDLRRASLGVDDPDDPYQSSSLRLQQVVMLHISDGQISFYTEK